MEALIAEHALASRVRVVEGGDTRQAVGEPGAQGPLRRRR